MSISDYKFISSFWFIRLKSLCWNSLSIKKIWVLKKCNNFVFEPICILKVFLKNRESATWIHYIIYDLLTLFYFFIFLFLFFLFLFFGFVYLEPDFTRNTFTLYVKNDLTSASVCILPNISCQVTTYIWLFLSCFSFVLGFKACFFLIGLLMQLLLCKPPMVEC